MSKIGFPLQNTQWIDPQTGLPSKDFFLFLQLLWKSVSGDSTQVSYDDIQIQEDIDYATGDTDGVVAMEAIAALERLGILTDEVPIQSTVDQDVQFIAFGEINSDPVPRAQPAVAITPGASPYSYTASFDGSVIVNPGTVSAIAISRDGTTFFTTGVTAGMFPMSRGDILKVTYTVAPTMTFLPR